MTSGFVPGPFDFAVYAPGTDCEAIEVSGNTSIDSFDSSQGPYAQSKQLSKGVVGVTGNIRLNGTVTIYGPRVLQNAARPRPTSPGRELELLPRKNRRCGDIEAPHNKLEFIENPLFDAEQAAGRLLDELAPIGVATLVFITGSVVGCRSESLQNGIQVRLAIDPSYPRSLMQRDRISQGCPITDCCTQYYLLNILWQTS